MSTSSPAAARGPASAYQGEDDREKYRMLLQTLPFPSIDLKENFRNTYWFVEKLVTDLEEWLVQNCGNTVVKSAKALPRWTSFEEMVETVIRGKGETSKILTKQIEIFGVQEQLDNLNRLIPHFFAASQFMDRLTVAESENTELLSGETTSFCHLQQTAKSFHKNIQTLFELRMELRVYTAKIRQNMGFLDDTDVLKSKLASEDWKTRMLNGYIQPALTDHLEGQSTHNARLGGAISTRNLMSMKTAMTLTQP